LFDVGETVDDALGSSVQGKFVNVVSITEGGVAVVAAGVVGSILGVVDVVRSMVVVVAVDVVSVVPQVSQRILFDVGETVDDALGFSV
jgi:hypothetical protein